MAPPALLTVRCLSGREATVELHDGYSVYELRRQLAATLGIVQGPKGLSPHGRILASDRNVAELLGLTADDVVPPPRPLRNRRAHTFLGVHSLEETFKLGDDRSEEQDTMAAEEKAAPFDLWEVDAIACLDSPEGQGYVIFGKP